MRRGLTLVETVLSMVAVFLLTTAVLTLVVRGRAVWRGTVGPSRAATEMVAVLNDLCAEMTDSSRRSICRVTVPGGGQGVAFCTGWSDQQFVTDGVSGAPVWQRYVVVGPVAQEGAAEGTFRWVVEAPVVARLQAGLSPFAPHDVQAEAAFTKAVAAAPFTRLGHARVGVVALDQPPDAPGLCRLRLDVATPHARMEVTRCVYVQN